MKRFLPALACSVCLICSGQVFVGLFEGHADIGTVLHPGSVEYDSATHRYTIVGSGENLWGTADALHFVWKKVSGDVTLTAAISFPDTKGDPHKKAVLMLRQNLDPDSAYADVAVHGNGLTSLQSRDEKGVATHEIQSNVSAPKRVAIEKRGTDFYIMVAGEGEQLHLAGGSMRVPLQEPFYAGIGVCAHNKDAVEKASFSNVEISPTSSKLAFHSTLETVTVASTDRRVTYVSTDRIKTPAWTTDGKSIIFTRNSKQWRIPVEGGEPETIGDAKSATPSASPDGKTIVFARERDGKTDIYTMSADGAPEVRPELRNETRLTTDTGSNDCPEYSPDGKYIYFSSNRGRSTMQIWRMRPDGTEPEQMTSGDFNNWFAHLSPDGRRMAFLSYDKGVVGHPADKDVKLRVMALSDKRIVVIAKLVGGQGTMDLPSWSPDSRRLAFVSYQLTQ